MSDAYVEFYDFIVSHADELPLLRDLAAKMADDEGVARVLECGCGTARLSLPLADDGHHITGLDASPTMLARAANRLAKHPRADALRPRLNLIHADFTAPAPDQVPTAHFDLAIFTSNTLGLVTDAAAQDRALAVAFAALRPGGMIYIEQLSPAGFFAEAFRQREVYHLFTRLNPATGLRTARFISFLHDAVNQHLFATTFVEEFFPDASGGGSRRHMFVEHMRYNTLPELLHRLTTAGFIDADVRGGYHGEPLDHRRLKMIVTARVPE